MLSAAWWENPSEVRSVEFMLVRAKVLPESERAYFRAGKAHKWRKEADFADRMEQIMMDAGIDPCDGWAMTPIDMARALMDPRVLLEPRMRRPVCPACATLGPHPHAGCTDVG